MKIFAILSLSLLAMLGCAGGGGSSATDSPTPPTTGSLVISLAGTGNKMAADVQGNSKADSLSDLTTNVRFLVTNANNPSFAKLADASVSEGEVAISLPVADGYVLEAVSYIAWGYNANQNCFNTILKYSKATGIDVTSTPTSVTLTLAAITSPMTVPDTFVYGNPITITAAPSSGALGIANNHVYLMSSQEAFPGSPASPYLFNSANVITGNNNPYNSQTNGDANGPNNQFTPSWTFTPTTNPASTPVTPGSFYYQVIYNMDPRFTMPSDNGGQNWGNNFLFIYPNPNLGDAQVSVPYTLPSGSLEVIVTY